ncbi:tripartite tricarboxylate transporter TctB family protein [Bacillus aerolatus]|uniref:Tripartite tricarboxylate transporter TctB family protein n=1 Tax=Bacillus aerolatus TaxID=2653354 RepID=A0A6I1FG40_9BACI|nr:tripartite tricarboxylate transporter TctB family protein [Bacillus aerolatus]KAB7707134.1 tripartite tricarboxylate transporter TctB family protein [Bacillus aerolatus]
MSKTFDRYAGIIFLLIGALFIVESRKISASSYGSNVGPDIFPIALGIVLILLSIRLLFETFKYSGKEKKKSKPDYKRFLIILAAAVLYVNLLESLGYVITTFLFLMVSFQVMERGGWLKTIMIAAAFSFGVYYLFVEVLQGSLPGFPI